MGAHLVAKGVTPDHDWVLPARYGAGDTVEDDGLTEDGSTKDVADSTVRALPHLLELELLHTGLVGGNSRALDADLMLEDGLSSLDRDLVIGLCGVQVPSIRTDDE